MMRVLIIEDDMDTASYISRGLAEEGHAVDHFSDGRETFTRSADIEDSISDVRSLSSDLWSSHRTGR